MSSNSRLRIISSDPSVGSCGAAGYEGVSSEESPNQRAPFMGNVAVVNLGCAKNQVDSEVMSGALLASGFQLVDDPESADIAVVNTCGFLQPAVEEGIDTIIDLAELKQRRLRTLVVAGCMVERYGEDLKESLPEVDHFIGGNDLLKVIDSATKGYDSPLAAGARPYFLYDDTVPRALPQSTFSAYVKISEGCDRPCAFCIIPKIRGNFRSRSVDSVVKEVQLLGEQGIREVNLVGQDLTAYGADLIKQDREKWSASGNAPFLHLLERLDAETDMPWVRLFYAYPLGVSPELLKFIAQAKRLVNYLDIPLQHASESVLKLMKRPLGKYAPVPLANLMRETAPEVAIRTTFIVGHPGETEQDVELLAQLLKDIRFEHVGIFTYSREEGTPSHKLPGQVPEEEKIARRNYLMELQQELQSEKLEGFIGKTVKVLLEGHHPESDLLLRGRAEWQGPEVDGEIIINEVADELSIEDCVAGSFVDVQVTETAGYDLVGQVIKINK